MDSAPPVPQNMNLYSANNKSNRYIMYVNFVTNMREFYHINIGWELSDLLGFTVNLHGFHRKKIPTSYYYCKRKEPMKTLARITAIILIITGILLLFGGLALAVTGVARSIMDTATAARPLRAGGSIGLLLLAFIFVEGLTVTALGEGLFLLAEVANKLRPV